MYHRTKLQTLPLLIVETSRTMMDEMFSICLDSVWFGSGLFDECKCVVFGLTFYWILHRRLGTIYLKCLQKHISSGQRGHNLLCWLISFTFIFWIDGFFSRTFRYKCFGITFKSLFCLCCCCFEVWKKQLVVSLKLSEINANLMWMHSDTPR